MLKEERILFPYVKQMAGGAGCSPSCFGTVQNPIRVMMLEHDNADEKLREIRWATNNYKLPMDACVSYSSLFSWSSNRTFTSTSIWRTTYSSRG